MITSHLCFFVQEVLATDYLYHSPLDVLATPPLHM